MAIKSYEAFKPPSPYEQERRRAEQQRRYAELLQQQALAEEEPFTYQGIRAMPSPLTALTKMLQAYGSKKALEKAEEAEQKAKEADLEGFEQLRRELGPQQQVMGPDMFADPMQMDSKYTPPQMQTVTPTQEEREDRLMRAMATGSPAAQKYAQLMLTREPKEAEYGTTPQYDDQGRAFVVSKAGNVRFLDNVKAPAAAPAAVTPATIMKNGKRVVIDARTGKEIGEAPEASPLVVNYGAPVGGVDEQGNPVFFQPSKTGGDVSIISGVRPSPKGMNEAQAKAAGFADRIAESTPVLDQGAVGVEARFLSGLPGGIGNFALTPNQQTFLQAERNFINSVLRRESGAVISEEEFANARQQYIPQPGDSEKVLEQKRRNRETVKRSFMRDAGPSYQPVIDLPPRR